MRIFSTLKYTGSAITNRFSTTTGNQEKVIFLDEAGTNLACQSLTIEAGAADLYFVPIESGVDHSTQNFNNDPVYFVAAGEKISISGISIIGLQFANALGAQYFVQGFGA